MFSSKDLRGEQRKRIVKKSAWSGQVRYSRRLAPTHARRNYKIKIQLYAGSDVRCRDISRSFLQVRFRKTSGEIASPIHGIPDDRRETSPVRNDRNNLPLSFVSCLIQGMALEEKKRRISKQYRDTWNRHFSNEPRLRSKLPYEKRPIPIFTYFKSTEKYFMQHLSFLFNRFPSCL